MSERFGAILAAAGNSTRMGRARSKVLTSLGGKTVLSWSLEVLLASPRVAELVIVCREEDMEEISALAAQVDTCKAVSIVTGGRTRQDSVRRGADALSEDVGYLLIHDGARPLVSPETVEAVCADAIKYGAATAAVQSKDTCKLMDGEGFVEATPPRERLMAVQTPQAFRRELYIRAYEEACKADALYTDDCQLLEAAGCRVKLTPGGYRNLKLTTPEDLAAARALVGEEERMDMRIGYGCDVHRLVEGRALILGGVEIPYPLGLLGHSDADVLCHAVADSLLGAAAMGDIGRLFPDTDPQCAGADSLKLLAIVCERLGEAGYRIGNIDATLVAQRPKIAPYVPQMRANLASACGIGVERVGVKATTFEKLGFTGRGEGMEARSIALLFG